MGTMLRGERSRFKDWCCSFHGNMDLRPSKKSPKYRTKEKRQWKKENNV